MNHSWSDEKILKNVFINGKDFPENDLFAKKIAELINRASKEKCSAV